MLDRIGPVLLRTSRRTKIGKYLLMSQGDPPCSSLLSHSQQVWPSVCLHSDQHRLNARLNKRSTWSEGVAKNAKRQTQGFAFLPSSCTFGCVPEHRGMDVLRHPVLSNITPPEHDDRPSRTMIGRAVLSAAERRRAIGTGSPTARPPRQARRWSAYHCFR